MQHCVLDSFLGQFDLVFACVIESGDGRCRE